MNVKSDGVRTGDINLIIDWKLIADSKIEKPFFLSGGIGPDDYSLVKAFKHPDFFGVDLNSLFEKEPGVKDMAQVLKFMHGLKK